MTNQPYEQSSQSNHSYDGYEATNDNENEDSISALNKLIEHKLAKNNLRGWGFDAHPFVTLVSGALVFLLVGLTVTFPSEAEQLFDSIRAEITGTTNWFFILVANIYLGVVIIVAFSKFGRIRLGGPKAKPEFSTSAWFAMLFSAGMGIGLMFWSVAEPVIHFNAPPSLWPITPGSARAAQAAMGMTFFHWGFHAWGIYALVGLALAFFTFNRKLPLTLRSVFYPLLGDRIFGWPGNIIDTIALLATLFGLATSLGFGSQQINSGLNFLLNIPISTGLQIFLITIITGLATLSVVSGLDKGVKILSEMNLYTAVGFMLFVLLVGPTLFILGSFVENLGYYFQVFPSLSFWTETIEGTNWQENWTLFYWGWWIAWSPFVGTFIARVSKGRTIREFVLGVLVIPSFVTFIWLSVFGGSALNLVLNGSEEIISAVDADVAIALFEMLKAFPLSWLSALIGVILIATFFVTSSDSGSLVVDNLASGGKLVTPVTQRIFWACTEGVVAGVLLLGGGLKALQTASITTGLPLAIVLLVMCFSLHRGLVAEWNMIETKQLKLLQADSLDGKERSLK